MLQFISDKKGAWFYKFDPKRLGPTIWSSFIMAVAGITTFIYGMNPIIWIWILSRFLWGFSYSALRFSTTQYGGFSRNTGSALGLSRGIQELGPILAYWMGPIMINSIGPEMTFTSWAISLSLLLPIMIFIPDIYPTVQKIKPFFHLKNQRLSI